jgi:diadenosine tetraphosphatase ApaH/serine/threonine PP2A family protein phosphatase
MLYYQGAGRRLMAFAPSPGVPVPVGRHRRWLAVAGSVGQPRDGNTAAAYAVLDTGAASLTFFRVPYDHPAAAAKIRAAGLPERFARRLEGLK